MPRSPSHQRQPITAPEPLKRAFLAAADLIWAAMLEAGAQTNQPEHPAVATSRATSRELAKLYGIPSDRRTMRALDARLKRFREKHFGCYEPVDPESNSDAEYIYYIHFVEPVLEAFRDSLGHSQE